MLQTALVLMGDAFQHHSALRRKQLLQHLNPQLKELMKEDFVALQPYLFGKDFGSIVKGKLEAAAALKKAVYPQSGKGKQGFQGGYPRKNSLGRGGSHQPNYGPVKYKKGSNSKVDKGQK